jgi:hypothetical protein
VSAPDRPRATARETERFHWSGRQLMVYSERLPIKYLVSNHGISLGIDSARTSFLFLACRDGLFLRTRPVGDTVVEDLEYEIPAIARALRDEDRQRAGERA